VSGRWRRLGSGAVPGTPGRVALALIAVSGMPAMHY